MKIIGVIPARYESSRLPGKPLADLCGKPMIWWVYQQAKKARGLDSVAVAADHEKVFAACRQYGIPFVETSPDHPSHVHRLLEFAQKTPADAYVCVCGDEPLIEPDVIEQVVPREQDLCEPVLVRGAYRLLTSPTETLDPGNIKIVTDARGQALAFSRTPIPNPYKTICFSYKKTIGVECFNRAALEFYVNSEKGEWERAEDIMMLRYLEHHIPAYFREVESTSLSVDTAKDLEAVRNILRARAQAETISEKNT